jgi:HlyD family secretion protein
MTANLTLTTQEKQNTIVVPQGVLIHRGEQTFVEVLVGEEIVEHEVTTGLTSLGQIEIISGLTEGEQVVLTPTP